MIGNGDRAEVTAQTMQGFNDKVGFIWSVADLLRGDFRAHEFGQVILPFVVLRRLECALAPTKQAVIARAASLQGKVDNVDPILKRTAGRKFYNLSPLDLTLLLNDAPNIAANLRTYVAGFSPRVLRTSYRSTASTTRSPASKPPGSCTKSCRSSLSSTCLRKPSATTRWATSSRSC